MPIALAFALLLNRAEAAPAQPPPLVLLEHKEVVLKVLPDWVIERAKLTLDDGDCGNSCSIILLSPPGWPVADFKVDRHLFNPDREERKPECKEVRVADAATFMQEYDCSREAPAECPRAPDGWLPPRFSWGGTCGKPAGTAKGPLGKMHLFEERLYNKGSHYYRKKGTPMRSMSIVYDIPGDKGAVYQFTLTAEKSVFKEFEPILRKMAESFRKK